MSAITERVQIINLGRQPYVPVWRAMQQYTAARDEGSVDQFWLVEHDPVFTQGQAGKAEHLLMPGDIPVVQVDRGGQVTYHGPGQQVLYFLLDLKRKKLGVRQLVTSIEQSVINLLAGYGITAAARPDAPGVYVDERKICSLGLKIKHGRSYHGLALNVNMDLQPFKRINPCGYAGLEVTQISDLGGPDSLSKVAPELIRCLAAELNYHQVEPAVMAPELLQGYPS